MSILKDTQNEPDERRLPIDRVGIKGLRFPLCIRDRNDQAQHTVGTVAMAVDLPHHFKGTHMSRFVEVLNSHGRELTVADVVQIPRELQKRLSAEKSHVEIRFPWFRLKTAPVSKAESMLDYGVAFETNADGADMDFKVTVEVPVTTLCPCSKAISRYGAHNQRGMVTLSIRFREPVWIEDMIEMVESSASSELYSLLKRPDEKHVTEQAYENPVFVEDLVRNIALKVQAHPQISWFRVEAENYESIHNHNAWAVIESSQ